jgi:hypothetical protein
MYCKPTDYVHASILRHFTKDDKGHLHDYTEVRG